MNLPSSFAVRAIQQQNLKKTIDLSNKESAGIGSLSSGLRFFVKCLHCNLELASRKQLKIHHRQEHPNLSIACFTTPKPISVNSTSA